MNEKYDRDATLAENFKTFIDNLIEAMQVLLNILAVFSAFTNDNEQSA